MVFFVLYFRVGVRCGLGGVGRCEMLYGIFVIKLLSAVYRVGIIIREGSFIVFFWSGFRD